MPVLTNLARLSTPDTLSTLLILLGTYVILEKERVAIGAGFLILAITARPRCYYQRLVDILLLDPHTADIDCEIRRGKRRGSTRLFWPGVGVGQLWLASPHVLPFRRLEHGLPAFQTSWAEGLSMDLRARVR